MSRGTGIAVVIVALALVSSLVTWTLVANTNSGNSNAATTAASVVPVGGPQPKVLVLHMPQYVESLVNESLILPNATILGPSYRIVGVSLDLLNLTATNGYRWGVAIYVWNGTFVNCTTTDADIQQGKGVIIAEGGFPSTKQLTQETLPEPPVSCVSFVKNRSSTCSTQTNTGGDYLVTQNGETILVNPQVHVLFLTYPAKHTVVTIFGGSHSVTESLHLSNSMTKPAG